MATYWENSCSFGLRYVSWSKYLIVSLVFSHLGFWSGNLFLIAPFPDLCLLVPFYGTLNLGAGGSEWGTSEISELLAQKSLIYKTFGQTSLIGKQLWPKKSLISKMFGLKIADQYKNGQSLNS